jgi:pilus assembly protein CpaB
MSVRSILVVLLAIVAGGSAALGIRTFLRNTRAESVAETQPVVVAAEEISRFQTLTPDVLAVKNYPKELVPEGSIQTLEDAVDRVTHASLGKGEALRAAKLGAKGAGRGLGAVLPNGMRAFTINAPSSTGFILPGSHVDVLRTARNAGVDDGTATVTILQNVEVLAVGERVDVAPGAKLDPKELRSVTLQVTPEQAQALATGQTGGTLHLTLRGHSDTSEMKLALAVPAPPEKKEEKKEPEPKETVRQSLYVPPPTPPVVRTLRGIYPGEVELR